MALAAAAVLLAVASVCPPSLANPAGGWRYSNSFSQYTIALGEVATVQSPGFSTSVPPSAKYGWNVLCLPTENTTLLISCYVNIEDSPLCYWSSLTIKTNDGARMFCGEEHVEKFVSSTGFARFEFSSGRKVIGEGFICNAECQAHEAIISSPTTLGTDANAATEAFEGDGEGSGELETVTSTEALEGNGEGSGELVTLTVAEGELETVTVAEGELKTVTVAEGELETVTVAEGELETVTVAEWELETETSSAASQDL